MGSTMQRANTPADFWARVDRSAGPDACWPWLGRRKPPTGGMQDGHGCYDHDGTWSYAHRYAYTLTVGPPQHFVLHHCDNPPCCNPRHLYDGTNKDNARDREARGRRNVWGERNPAAKITDLQALEIAALYATGRYTQKQLGSRYGISHSMVGLIAKGRRGRHA
jgi:hypothetical protein